MLRSQRQHAGFRAHLGHGEGTGESLEQTPQNGLWSAEQRSVVKGEIPSLLEGFALLPPPPVFSMPVVCTRFPGCVGSLSSAGGAASRQGRRHCQMCRASLAADGTCCGSCFTSNSPSGLIGSDLQVCLYSCNYNWCYIASCFNLWLCQMCL